MNKMKRSTKDILKAVIVLGAIALAAGLLLGIVYPLTRLTQEEIDRRAMKPLPSIYPAEGYEVVYYTPADESLGENVSYLFRALGKKDAYITLSKAKGYNDDLNVYTVFEGKEIVKVQKGANNETIELEDYFFQKFYGVDITRHESFAVGEDIDKQVGATMSSEGVTKAVNYAVQYYREFISETVEYERLADGTLRFSVTANGWYADEATGNKTYKVIKLLVDVKDGVIQSVADNGSTFSPPQWSPGLAPDNLNRYVGKSIVGRGDFVLGEEIDVAAGATGTSRALARAMNMIVAFYNGGGVA